MSARDKVVTVKGTDTAVKVMELHVQDDGAVVVVVRGETKDSEGNVVGLAPAAGRLQASDIVVNILLQVARQALRQENGLDSDPVKVLQSLEVAKES
jgi:hypothetical protein